MAIALVNTSQASDYSGGAFSSLVLTAASLTAGNFIVVVCRIYPATNIVNSVTDTAGNTYIKAIGRANTFAGTRVEIWYAYNTLGNAANVVTVNLSGSSMYSGAVSAQYSGIKTDGDPLDTTAIGDTSAGTSLVSGAFTTLQADELIICGCDYDAAVGAVWTAGAGFTIQKQDASSVEVLQDKIVSVIQTGVTASMTLGTARNLSMNVATFKMQSSGKPSYPNNFKFIRVGNGMSASERIK